MPQTKEGKGNLRVIHRDQLQVIRAGGNPRVPDCYQKTPKRIPVNEQGQILTVAVDSRGNVLSCFILLLFIGIPLHYGCWEIYAHICSCNFDFRVLYYCVCVLFLIGSNGFYCHNEMISLPNN